VTQPRLPLRLILLAALALGAALLIGLVIATLNSALEFYQRLVDLPLWLRVPLIGIGALLLAKRVDDRAHGLAPRCVEWFGG